jgi:hypothetical protein
VVYLGLALDPAYVEGFIEGGLERMGRTTQRVKHHSGTIGRTRERETVMTIVQAECELRAGVCPVHRQMVPVPGEYQ